MPADGVVMAEDDSAAAEAEVEEKTSTRKDASVKEDE